MVYEHGNRALKGILGPREEEVTGGWRELRNECFTEGRL
jgi:hypothetical protein